MDSDENTNDRTEDSKMVYINSVCLIAEVKKRPLLYDSTVGAYNDRLKKAQAWDDICKAVIKQWDQLNPTEKSNCCKYQLKKYIL